MKNVTRRGFLRGMLGAAAAATILVPERRIWAMGGAPSLYHSGVTYKEGDVSFWNPESYEGANYEGGCSYDSGAHLRGLTPEEPGVFVDSEGRRISMRDFSEGDKYDSIVIRANGDVSVNKVQFEEMQASDAEMRRNHTNLDALHRRALELFNHHGQALAV